MLVALILVCSLASIPDLAACTQDNAVEVMYVPNTFANPVTCVMHGQVFLAETSIGLDLAQNEAVKVICMRGRSAQDARCTRDFHTAPSRHCSSFSGAIFSK